MALSATKDDGWFRIALNAAFARAYELGMASSCATATNNEFFLVPSVRGVFEDLVSLRWLNSLPEKDREDYCSAIAALRVEALLKGQERFFQIHRPGQRIFRRDDLKIDKHAAQRTLRRLHERYAWPGSPTEPSVEWLAVQTGLGPVYRFVYATTSRYVHFTPHLLWRTGRGSDEAGYYFSVHHQSAYHRDFLIVYSTYLLLLFYGAFRADLDPEGLLASVIVRLKRSLDRRHAWPEALTPEEIAEPE